MNLIYFAFGFYSFGLILICFLVNWQAKKPMIEGFVCVVQWLLWPLTLITWVVWAFIFAAIETYKSYKN